MIMGGSRIAVRTTQYVPDYMQVKIIENDINRCNRLTEAVDEKSNDYQRRWAGYGFTHGRRIKEYRGFVALTDNSETNILPVLPLNAWE
mgnify:CR=1 FL=1